MMAVDQREGLALGQGDVLSALENYWRALSNSNRLPARTDVDPRLIDQALPSSMILEEVNEGHARIRVAGQNVAGHFEFDLRGMSVTSLFSPCSADMIFDGLRHVFRKPALVAFPLVCGGAVIFLPLQDRFGRPTRALCGIHFGRGAIPLKVDQTTSPRIEILSSGLQSKRPTQRPALRLVVNNA